MGKSERKQTGAHDPKTGEKRVDKVTLKELREKFYELRDLEIQNLWQRASIFAGLIGLFFAGYGYILIGFLVEGEGEIKEVERAHVLCCGIALLAIIFSVIWIAMAKGAKAWFEVQERKICEIEEEEELAIPARFRMGALSYPGIDSEPNDCLLSGEGGRYSVSKLNVLLGQIPLVLWCLILGFHMTRLIIPKLFAEIVGFLKGLFYSEDPTVCQVLAVLVVIIILALLFFWLPKGAKSGALLTAEGYLEKRLDLLKEDLESRKVNLGKIREELESILPSYVEGLGKYGERTEKNRRQYIKEEVDSILERIQEEELKTEISLFFKNVLEVIDNEQKKLESRWMYRLIIEIRSCFDKDSCICKLIKKRSCERKKIILTDSEKKYIREKYIEPLLEKLSQKD